MNAIKSAMIVRKLYPNTIVVNTEQMPAPANRPALQSEGSERLIETYRRWFDTIVVSSAAEREQAHRLRYQVYCIENQFERREEHPDGLERDAYDSHAVHCLLMHRPTGAAAGTVRLVLPQPDAPKDSFAIQRVCRDPLIDDPEHFPVERTAEVSRFSIAKSFRQRRGDGLYPISLDMPDGPALAGEWRRVVPNMTLGLIEGLIRMSIDNDIHAWCAVMEPPLLRLLTRFGINFRPVGPPVIYHGHRQPSVIRLDTMFEEVRVKRPDIWDVLTDDGRHYDAYRAKLSLAAPVGGAR
jgi:N-acyl amino acid synthase of PEP-CTERM/exosortase system